jgi:hypothetical protein
MGEYVVGAYLRIVMGCQNVIYNLKPGRQLEIDVVGLDFRKRIVYLCEAKTHIGGLMISKKGLGDVTESTVERQLEDLQRFGKKYWRGFKPKYMFWSPYVPVGKKTASLERIRSKLGGSIEMVVNSEYRRRVEEIRKKAARDSSDSGEPFYRALQILEHMRNTG